MKKRTRYAIPAVLSGLGLCFSLLGSASAQAPAPAPAAAPAAPAAAPAAPAAETAESLLKRVDRAGTSFKDAIFEFTMDIFEPSGSKREVSFTTMQKGQKRLVRFTAPGDIKGMGILIERADVMYALLPQFGNRIRRIASHQMGGNFMGSDVSNDDMGLTEYAPLYAPKLVGMDNGQSVLELTLLPGKTASTPRLKLWVEPKNALIQKIEYYGADGKKLRTQTRLDYKQDSPEHYSPGKMIFIDHIRNDHKTELILNKSQLNTNMADDVFTQRSLQRG